MKVAIPAESRSMDSDICLSFGRAPYFLIFDTLTRTPNFIENSAANTRNW